MINIGNRKYKLRRADVTYGPQLPDELTAFVIAGELMSKGYRKVSTAYCILARIDREDWLQVLAKERHCSIADFYNVDGSGVGNSHRDFYVRAHSKDQIIVAPEVARYVSGWI